MLHYRALNMRLQLLLLIAVLRLATDVDAIIPLPCANDESLASRTCCPVPVFDEDAGPCGVNLGRGSCQAIAIPETDFDPNEVDVRVNWPIQYFNTTCVCGERYGGYDCRECSYAYNDGTTDCATKTIRSRKSVGEMADDEWTKYRGALATVKLDPSRYMVATTNFTTDWQASLVRPTTYDLFIWMHHTCAKDNDVTLALAPDGFVDFAHEGTGFPTWHRLFLLWLEREIQIAIDDHLFRLPYWDWRDPSQREILFETDRLGANVNGNVEGDLFGENWKTVCWVDTSSEVKAPIPICNPTIPDGQNLRRCPSNDHCDKDHPNWPSYEDVDKAVSIDSYDTSPYNRFVTDTDESFRNYMEGFITALGSECDKDADESFRNYMEGFITALGSECDKDDTLCSVHLYQGQNHTVTRKLHNTGHLIVGIGDFQFARQLSFAQVGVMSCVAASPNDPAFVNHHGMVDCILEEWLQKNKDAIYPMSDEIREGHRANDYIVPFMPLHMHKDVFKTAENFGYSCSLPPDDDEDSSNASKVFTSLVVSMLLAAVVSNL